MASPRDLALRCPLLGVVFVVFALLVQPGVGSGDCQDPRGSDSESCPAQASPTEDQASMLQMAGGGAQVLQTAAGDVTVCNEVRKTALDGVNPALVPKEWTIMDSKSGGGNGVYKALCYSKYPIKGEVKPPGDGGITNWAIAGVKPSQSTYTIFRVFDDQPENVPAPLWAEFNVNSTEVGSAVGGSSGCGHWWSPSTMKLTDVKTYFDQVGVCTDNWFDNKTKDKKGGKGNQGGYIVRCDVTNPGGFGFGQTQTMKCVKDDGTVHLTGVANPPSSAPLQLNVPDWKTPDQQATCWWCKTKKNSFDCDGGVRGLDCAGGGSCPTKNQDPYDSTYKYKSPKGKCCPGLYAIKSKWSGAKCTYKCKACLKSGQDPFQYCKCGADSCEVPCCHGLKKTKVGAHYMCK